VTLAGVQLRAGMSHVKNKKISGLPEKSIFQIENFGKNILQPSKNPQGHHEMYSPLCTHEPWQ
jgi:hypothetical protein